MLGGEGFSVDIGKRPRVLMEKLCYEAKGISVVSHISVYPTGRHRFYPHVDQVALWTATEQGHGSGLVGTELQKRLRTMRPLNATMLQFLLSTPEGSQIISEDWRIDRICFWGTEFKNLHGGRFILMMWWSKVCGKWVLEEKNIRTHFDSTFMAACWNMPPLRLVSVR